MKDKLKKLTKNKKRLQEKKEIHSFFNIIFIGKSLERNI